MAKLAKKSALPKKDADLVKRITSNPKQCSGAPCVRGMRIRVSDVLSLLAGGDDEARISDDLDIEIQDVRACLAYAAAYINHPRLVA